MKLTEVVFRLKLIHYYLMKRKVMCFLFFLQCAFPASIVAADTTDERAAIKMIEEFYRAYASETPSLSKDSLSKKYLTKRLIEKVGRMTMATGVGPILRSQDTSEDIVNTLTVNRLGDDWYMVNYTWGKGGQFEKTVNIPLKVVQVRGQYMIDYITPEWNGILYGDSLLCEHSELPAIDASDPVALLRTFYDVYTMEYASMPENLSVRLAALRTAYLTPKALKQFDEAANEEKLDGYIGYDLLIGDFDFDCLDRSPAKVTQLDEDTYQICYTKSKTPSVLKFKLVKQGQEYRIDDISKE